MNINGEIPLARKQGKNQNTQGNSNQATDMIIEEGNRGSGCNPNKT
jgi:hypothetical protein